MPRPQVCAAAEAIACASSLQDLVSTLCSTVAHTLATDLHIDLATRLLLVPHRDAPTGVLVESCRAAARAAPNSATHLRMHMSPHVPRQPPSPRSASWLLGSREVRGCSGGPVGAPWAAAGAGPGGPAAGSSRVAVMQVAAARWVWVHSEAACGTRGRVENTWYGFLHVQRHAAIT